MSDLDSQILQVLQDVATRQGQMQNDLRTLLLQQEALQQEIRRLSAQQEGFSDASRMLVEALMTWSQTEPSQMWRQTQGWLQRIQELATNAMETYWTDEAQKLWISKIVEESVSQVNELMAEYREKISQRANRAIASMDTAFQVKLDDMGESAAEQYAQVLTNVRTETEQMIRQMALDQKKVLETLVQRLVGDAGGS
jgi:hypothetical protein